MSDASNTGFNKGKFRKGDPRINRKGRPRSFDALRALAQEICHEPITRKGRFVLIDGHAITVTEAILRDWAQSRNPMLQRAFIEIAFGKVPDKLDVNTLPQIVEVKFANEGAAPTPAPEAA